jgi:hypothetical protein
VGLDDAALGGLLGGHEAGAVVDADRGVGVVGQMRGDGASVLPDEREDVGEIALAAVEPDLVEGGEEGVRVEDVGAEVDLANRQLVL